MTHDKLNTIFASKSNLLTIGENSTFGQTIKKIYKAKNADFVLVKKTRTLPMAAVMAARLAGKKFLWVQNFANPPAPNFLSKLLITQADRVLVTTRRDAKKLKTFGVDSAKIRTHRVLP